MKKLLIFAYFLCSGIFCHAQSLRFEEGNGTVTLVENGTPRYTYQSDTKSLDGRYPRANYIHPLYDMQGNMLTEDFPGDHPHHRGIFWTWHQLFAGEERLADPWFCENITWTNENIQTRIKSNSAVLETEVLWKAGEEGEAVIREKTSITYSPGNGFYILDFDTTLSGLREDIRIGGSEDDKGYGGFSARIHAAKSISFFSGKGEVAPRNTAVQAGNWIQAIPDYGAGKEQTGVIIMCEPEKLPSFQGWILRAEKSMQNPAFPGRGLLGVPVDEPLKFRHRVIVHHRKLPVARIEKLYRDFAD
ncbi:DUF6807 family protein [Sinomicrobium soli]|uniref:DUF6807 family protein n=1 Tax=Sinomicrobium sp. N-1-3-6 TaxID=2219864 RepID=UPI000DCF3395|nr:DUF6807 family protein [Sinomicrobium sp. N-1-3-6]RAV28133.1 hypothetical protein DN748_14935 [Sinomicrobium sp. N-1-3-6]